MIELKNDQLVFSFPEVHPQAVLHIEFERTLRIPDDDKIYPLPPGLGCFPLEHVDDFASRVPAKWIEYGGVILPMYQAEAMWLYFTPSYVERRWAQYPFAVKVSTGKIDAITGQSFSAGLHRNPQDYLVSPSQPWLDGYCVKKGLIRQFVAMPLGEGYSAEEQLTGAAEYGGLQLVVYPMKREAFERHFPERAQPRFELMGVYGEAQCASAAAAPAGMGLAPGGQMRQEIYKDSYELADWDLTHSSRCFVNIANSIVWKQITGLYPPLKPPTAADYTAAGLPWFDYYSEQPALKGSKDLAKLKSVFSKAQEKEEQPALDGNASCNPEVIIKLRQGLKKDQVREFAF